MLPNQLTSLFASSLIQPSFLLLIFALQIHFLQRNSQTPRLLTLNPSSATGFLIRLACVALVAILERQWTNQRPTKERSARH
jgi:hypothetical protein